tara:strand:+ start:523 stop:798 length:276 start_codon:yes stop_codon:yes gene_type:complete
VNQLESISHRTSVRHSITKLLQAPKAAWKFPAITTHGRGNYSVEPEAHRCFRHANGEKELYDLVADPFEWKNLVSESSTNEIKEQLAAWLP